MLRIKMEGNFNERQLERNAGFYGSRIWGGRRRCCIKPPVGGCLIERIADTTEGTLKYSWLSKQTIS
jgi:hypothetical protein